MAKGNGRMGKKRTKKRLATHKEMEEFRDSIAKARSGSGVRSMHDRSTDMDPEDPTYKMPKSKSKSKGAGTGWGPAAFKRAEDKAFGDMPGTGYVRGPGGHGTKKKGKSRLSRMFSAIDKKVFGGALPGGAKRKKKNLGDLVADTSAASKAKKKKNGKKNGRGKPPAGRRTHVPKGTRKSPKPSYEGSWVGRGTDELSGSGDVYRKKYKNRDSQLARRSNRSTIIA